MKKDVKAFIFILAYFLVQRSLLLFPAPKIKNNELSPQYKEWLDLTKYIIHEKEKDVFMKLANDRDRNVFIEAFWKQRDPTPGTPQNEFKEEHLRRYMHANKNFGRNSPREGWMTDMGRIYIILGEPVSIERFEGTQDIYPAEVWSYYGNAEKGLPSHFSLVFFQRSGSGEYKLYDPASDGPASLYIPSRNMDQLDYEELFTKIKEVAPTLALVSLSIIPGDIPYNFQPSPQNAIILANILESAQKAINPTYSTHFLYYKGVVSTEYLTNFVESEAQAALIQDPLTGLTFLHFSVVPKSISIDYFEPKSQYFCNFSLNVSLRAGEDNIIFQYAREYPFYFSSEELQKVRRSGLAIEDSFPVIKGKYKLNILLQNSVGKEFSVLEKDIDVPDNTGLPRIDSPVLGYGFQSYASDLQIPFKISDKKLIIDPKNSFSTSDNILIFYNILNFTQSLWKGGETRIYIKGSQPNNPSPKSIVLRLSDYPFNKTLSIEQTIPARELSPDYYEMRLELTEAGGKVVDEKKVNFVVSPIEVIAHPIAHSRAFPLSSNFLYYYILGHQYEKVKDFERAEASYSRAYQINPGYKKGLLDYVSFLFAIKKFEKCLELIETIKDDEKLRFDYHLMKGRAYLGLGNYGKALENLLAGNQIYNSDIRLLNSLGFCYYQTRQKEQALKALNASLRLNPGQKDIQELVAKINEELE
jgi:GWxTD domain-containing protein